MKIKKWPTPLKISGGLAGGRQADHHSKRHHGAPRRPFGGEGQGLLPIVPGNDFEADGADLDVKDIYGINGRHQVMPG